jgi:uncharacterized membrane protein YbhN (UPF0104 family)
VKLGSLLALAVGLALLGLVIANSNLAQVAELMTGLSWRGAAAVMALFALAWAAEILAWALTFTQRAARGLWLWQLWLVNMVGEAMNVVMPFGSLGGEPVKAWLLKRHYHVAYREAAATLVLMQTLLALAEALFVAVGALLASTLGLLPPAIERLLGGAALALVALMVVAMIGLHQRWLRHVLAAFERRFGGARYAAIKDSVAEVEHALAHFARAQPRRFVQSTLLFLANWIGGAAEVWLLLKLLGQALPLADCWVAEAAVVTIRSLTFFLPAQLGSVEAVTVYVIGALGGSADVGLALAALRRARELAWSALGLGVGAAYHLDWRAAARAANN